MNLIRDDERGFASAVSRLAHCNPFLPERVDLEQQALGAQFVPLGGTWHARGESELRPNLSRLQERSEAFVPAVRERLVAGGRFAPQELSTYADVAVYLLFERYEHDFLQLIIGAHPARPRVAFYHRFRRDFDSLLALPGITLPDAQDPLHIFACLFQVRRAFHFIFQNILGGSMAAARLRAAVWQSIFTRDMRRYRRSLYQRMGDMATLISGPSGTGKELVARAIGLARYIPFDPEREAFAEDFAGAFYALNLSALSPTLIESELFGHRRGAFTGALQDRSGWLDVCPQFGAVFLDEIGELDVSIQVKLLRVLQSRTFQRLGDTRDRTFRGKIIAATNRDLKREILTGRFREDFYYRLCSDLISTPSLREQLRESPDELPALIRFIAARVAGDEEAEELARESQHWIDSNLGSDYDWPGNVRELEQCVRNIMIRGEYHPHHASSRAVPAEVADAIVEGSLSAEDMLRRYCTLVYAKTGSYQETARRLGLDRRTVRQKIEPGLLDRLRNADGDDSGRRGPAGGL